jgi:hypothetical protein
MKMIYLYIKESPLGLKYLGKTERNPFKYVGSGTYWKKHLKKHKFTYEDIKTTILFETTNKEDLKNKGIYYSELYDIVDSKEWANLRTEEGDGGDTSKFIDWEKFNSVSRLRGDKHWTRNMSEKQKELLSNQIKGNKNPACRPDVREKIRQKALGRTFSEEIKQKMSENRKAEKNFYYGKKHTEEIKQKMKEKAKGRYSLNWFVEKYGENGNKLYEEKCQSLRGKKTKKIIRTELQCPYCNLIGKGPNMKRYHFDNCKNK